MTKKLNRKSHCDLSLNTFQKKIRSQVTKGFRSADKIIQKLIFQTNDFDSELKYQHKNRKIDQNKNLNLYPNETKKRKNSNKRVDLMRTRPSAGTS